MKKSKAPPLLVELLEDRSLLSVSPLYYSYDGTGNNLAHPDWGAAQTPLVRVVGPAYGDGISTMAGANRPSARLISNAISSQDDSEPNARNLSNMIYAWGQFIDHDLDLTPSGTTSSQPIVVPTGDPVFDPTGTGTAKIGFRRAATVAGTGTSKSNPLLQPNTVTSFLDGSMVYGSDAARAAALRSFTGGRLKTSDGDLLPFNTDSLPEEVHLPGVSPSDLFLTGDIRGNENSELTSLQVLFLREHNYWAGQLQAQHPTWTDEQLYQGARQIVIAEIQHITYDEFLPALLGNNALGAYKGYNPTVNPGISAEFSAAAFRLGHTQLNDDIDFLNNDGSVSHDPIDINASADNPTLLQQDGTRIDNILKYLVADNAQEVDTHIMDAFRNFLFSPNGTAGIDLNAIDIQRGRDMGLPDYNTVRAAYGLPKVTSFSQITSDPALQTALKNLYGNVNNIDLFVGGLAEKTLKGSSVGATFTAIMVNQFNRLRAGDRLWYQRTFSGADLQAIQQTTLSDIISRNTSLSNLQSNVFFFTPGIISGKITIAGWPSYNAIPSQLVKLYNADGKLVAQTKSKADGTYQFLNQQPGQSYTVVVVTPWYLQNNNPKYSLTLDAGESSGEYCADMTLSLLPSLAQNQGLLERLCRTSLIRM